MAQEHVVQAAIARTNRHSWPASSCRAPARSTSTSRRMPSGPVSAATTPTCVNNPGERSVNKLYGDGLRISSQSPGCTSNRPNRSRSSVRPFCAPLVEPRQQLIDPRFLTGPPLVGADSGKQVVQLASCDGRLGRLGILPRPQVLRQVRHWRIVSAAANSRLGGVFGSRANAATCGSKIHLTRDGDQVQHLPLHRWRRRLDAVGRVGGHGIEQQRPDGHQARRSNYDGPPARPKIGPAPPATPILPPRHNSTHRTANSAAGPTNRSSPKSWRENGGSKSCCVVLSSAAIPVRSSNVRLSARSTRSFESSSRLTMCVNSSGVGGGSNLAVSADQPTIPSVSRPNSAMSSEPKSAALRGNFASSRSSQLPSAASALRNAGPPPAGGFGCIGAIVGPLLAVVSRSESSAARRGRKCR